MCVIRKDLKINITPGKKGGCGREFGLERKRDDGLEFSRLCKVGAVMLAPPNMAPTRKVALMISILCGLNFKIKIC